MKEVTIHALICFYALSHTVQEIRKHDTRLDSIEYKEAFYPKMTWKEFLKADDSLITKYYGHKTEDVISINQRSMILESLRGK